ncbi:hypothetical protein HanHA300_Chr10g0365021 [Helianthus annuus]|nr:hypothetical protein HanHA300_Chr10g0365021 [Helianthus annuus]KAJ0697043.1 hypothetical protein HanLR1_Chr10g0364281 [Helianthus annuus]KAJ0700467.1 hypothetical protein HanOQP8_Chr10g0368201 [Helianthus annuus]
MATSSTSTKGFIWPASSAYVADAQSLTGSIRLLNKLWNDVAESQKWQEGVFYALCAGYALVSLIALV